MDPHHPIFIKMLLCECYHSIQKHRESCCAAVAGLLYVGFTQILFISLEIHASQWLPGLHFPYTNWGSWCIMGTEFYHPICYLLTLLPLRILTQSWYIWTGIQQQCWLAFFIRLHFLCQTVLPKVLMLGNQAPKVLSATKQRASHFPGWVTGGGLKNSTDLSVSLSILCGTQGGQNPNLTLSVA